jgi:hypothetical protein
MKAKYTLSLVLLCVLALVMAMAASCGGGSVAADEAQIEMTYTGEGTSYVGDREIIEGGPATVTFSNDTTGLVLVDVLRYETGSDELAQELALVEEGNSVVPSGPPGAGYVRAWSGGLGGLEPGNHTWTMDLEPGTYLFDAGPEDFMTTGMWRVAVIEVVAQ